MDDELRVGIRVTPDMTNFAQDVQKGASRAIPGGISLPVEVVADIAAIRKAAEAIQSALNRSITITPDVSGLAETVRREIQKAVPSQGIEVPIQPQAKSLTEWRSETRKMLDDLATTGSAKIAPESERAYQQLNKQAKARLFQEHEIERAQKRQLANLRQMERLSTANASDRTANLVRRNQRNDDIRRLSEDNADLQREYDLEPASLVSSYATNLDILAAQSLERADQALASLVSKGVNIDRLTQAMQELKNASQATSEQISNLNSLLNAAQKEAAQLDAAASGMNAQRRTAASIQRLRADLEHTWQQHAGALQDPELGQRYDALQSRMSESMSDDDVRTLRAEMQALNADIRTVEDSLKREEQQSRAINDVLREREQRLQRIMEISIKIASSPQLKPDAYSRLTSELSQLYSADRSAAEQYGLGEARVNAAQIAQFKSAVQEAVAQAQQLRTALEGVDGVHLGDLDDAIARVGDAADASVDDVHDLYNAMNRAKAQADELSTSLKSIYSQSRLQNDIQKARADLEDTGRRWGALFTSDDFSSRYRNMLGRLTEDISADELKNIRSEMRMFNAEVRAAGLNAQSFGQKWQNAFSKFSEWFGIASVVTSAVGVVRNMITAVTDLDAKVTDLQIASGKSRDEVYQMVRDYADMGVELGSVATDVAAAADTFLRQGQSMSATNELVRDSMMLSRLGQIDAAEASTALTSAMKGYQVEAEEAVRIVDRLTAVDMEAAADAGSLAVAMSETANSARLAGIEMDRLIGYLAVVQEVTQDAPESVGTFFRTLMSRMGNIKAGRLIDPETSEDLSDVEATLSGAGIQLRSADDEFRNFGDVLDEVSGKWDNYSNVQQRAIATAFAGTMQQERFLVLMENYETAMGYMDTAANSAGTAAEKYEAYLDGIEAKSQAFQAQFQKLSSTIVSSDLVSGVFDAGTGILGFLDAVISKIGVIPTAGVAGGIGSFVQYVRELQKATDSMRNTPDINLGNAQQVAEALSGMTKYQQSLLASMSNLDAAGLKQARTWATMIQQGQLVTNSAVMQSAAIQQLTQTQRNSVAAALQKNSIDQQGVLIMRHKVAASIEEALAGDATTKMVVANTTATIANNVQKQRATRLTLAQVAANIKLMAANPMTWIALIPTAISAVVQVVDALTTSVEEHIERINEAKSAYQDATTELESLEQQLEENKASIDELLKMRSSDDWTLVKQEDLDNLARENALLQEQIDLEKERQELTWDEYEKEFADRFDATRGGGDARLDRDWSQYTTSMALQSTEIGQTNAELADRYGLGDREIIAARQTGIEAWTEFYLDQIEVAKQAIADGNQDLAASAMQEFSTAVDEIEFGRSQLSETIGNYEDYKDIFARYEYDIAQMPESIAEAYKDYQSAVQAFADSSDFDTQARQSAVQSIIFDSGEFDAEINKLAELRAQGELTTETLSDTAGLEGLRDALDALGLSAGEFTVAYDSAMASYESAARVLSVDEYRIAIDNLAELARRGQLTVDTMSDPAWSSFANTLRRNGVEVEAFVGVMQRLGRSASIVASDDFADVSDALRSLATSGRLTADEFRNNPVFDPLEQQCLDAGIAVEKFIQQLSWFYTTWPNLDFTNTSLTGIADDAESAYYRVMMMNTRSQINNLDPASATYEADYTKLTAQLNEYKRQLDLVGQSFDDNIMAGIEAATNTMPELEQAISDLQSGAFEDWDAEFIEELVKAVPEAADELYELADGTKEAEEVAGDLGLVWGQLKGEELGEAFSDVGEAVETYGEDSRQAHEAIEALSSVLPTLNGLLYDESGQLTTVGQQALLAANGNREAAIAVLQAANAAERASMQKLITEYSQLSVEAREAAQAVFQLKLAEHSDNIQANDKVIATWKTANSLPGFSSSGGGGGGGGGGSSSSEDEDVLAAYKKDKEILDHRVDMSEAAQDMTEEETEAWEKEQQNQLNIYLEYADRIKNEMDRLRELGYADDSEEMNQLESDLADVYTNIYNIQKDAFEKAKDARIEAIEDELEAAEKAHEAEIEMLEAYINRYEALIGLLENQHDLASNLRDERNELNRELSKAQSYVNLTDDERAALFSDADYNQLMSMLDDIQAESVAMYNDYVNQINAVNIDEAYKLDYITAEYEAQYELMAKKYEIAKQDLAIARARIALENAQNNRNVAMLVNGRWTWQADPEAVQSAMDTMYDAENAANEAQMNMSYQQQMSQLEIWKAQVELERDAAEAAFEAIREALENQIELLEEQEFIMEDENIAMGISVDNMYGFADGVEGAGNALASATSSAVSAVNAAASSAARSISSMMSELSDYSQKVAKESSYSDRPYDGLRSSGGSSGKSSSSSSRGGGSGLSNKVQFFSEGGVMSSTGPAILHGSHSAPEVVFNAADAAKLYDLVHGGDYMQNMFRNLIANLRGSMSAITPNTPTAQTAPVQYIVNGLTFGPESSGLTLGELANQLTSAAPFLR